jgi:hypothetical protein
MLIRTWLRTNDNQKTNKEEPWRTRAGTMPTLFSYLFRPLPAEFRSEYPLEESVERLRAAVKPSIFPLHAAVGKVRQGRVSIWRPFGFNTFVGSFREKSGHVVLAGAFTFDLPSFLSRAIGIFGLGFFWFLAVLDAFPESERIVAIVALAFAFGVECLDCLLGHWSSRTDVIWLSSLIRRALSNKATCRMSQARYRRLWQMFGAFFHQDWHTEGEDWPDLVRNYARGLPQAELDATASELDRLLADFDDDASLNRELFEVLGCSYMPQPDRGGPMVRLWLRQVAAFLRAGAPRV